PWKLDPYNPTAAATNGDNIVDNIEKIEIMLPDAGQYLVEVTHKGEIVDPTNDNNKRQSFSLVISGIAEREIDLALTNANVMVSGCGFNEQTPAFITVENKGQQTIENITVSYQLTDPLFNILHEGTMNLDMIQAGHSEDLLFDLDLSEGFEFILSASVNFPGDQLPANNTFTRNIISESFQVSDNAFQESFEGIVYLEEVGWQVLNENEDNASWMLRIADGPNQFASDGANSMRYGILNPEEDGTEVENQADDWLISTCLYLVPGENYRLSFDYRTWTGEYSENMKVMIGQVPEPGMLTTELVDLNAFTNSEFVTHMQQFTVETEGNYYIAFQVYSDPGHGFVYLDNIVVERMVFNDLAPVSINVAAQGCEFSEATPVEVSFANMGLDPQENFDIQLWVKHETSDTEYTINYTFEGALESEQTASHEFLADMAASGTYEVRLITALAGDENPQNDTLSIEVTNTGVNLANTNYFTDFNGVTQLEQMGWSVHSGTSGSTGWRMGQVPGHANSPPNSLNFYRSDESPVDEWAFTNCFVMEEGVYYRLRFMTATKGTNTEEYFWIYLLNEPSHEAEKELIGEVFVNHFDHQQRELIFQAPSTGYFHIGFFTDFVGPNTFQIYVDDFTVEKVLEKDAAALSIIQKEWGCNSFTDQTPVDIVIENKGLEQLAMASVVLTVEDEEQNQELYELDSELTLGLAEKDTLEFMVDLSAYNTLYTLTAEVVLADDDDPGNNTVVGVIRNTTVDLTVGQEYFTDFEQVTIDGHSDLVDPKTGWWYENTNNDFDIEGGPVTWVMRKNESFALSGEVSMRSGRNQEEAADDWLFTNCYIMNAGENYLFDFYYTGRTVSSTEKMSVYLGNAQQSEAMEQLLWDKTFNLGLDYQQAFVVVSPPEDGTYYIGFNHHSNPDEGWVYLDDVGMRKNFDLDVAVDSIVVEQQSCGFSENTPLNVTVKNTGNLAFDYPVTLTVTVTDPDGQMVFTAEETIEQAMEVNDVLDFNFFADMRKYGKYSIEAFVALPAEANESLTENNVISVEIRNTSMFPHVENLYVTFEDFENMQETGFTRSDLNNDGFTWDLGTTFTNYSFSGSSVFYYSFSTSNAANDWLFSSCAHLQAGTVYNVSYYYRVYSGDYPEDMTFVLASEPHSDAIVQVLDVKEEMDNYNFRRVQYAFTVAEDGTYYFGWHASSPKYHRFMFMDDFSLRVAPQVDGTVRDVEPVAETCDFTEEATFEATLVNLGSETLPEGSLSVTVSGPGPVQEILVNTPSVSALETAQVEFTASLTGNDRHTFQHQLSVPGDEVTGNNSGTMSLFPYALDLQLPGSWFIQDFETIFALREIGWTIHNTNNDNRYWGLRVNDPSLAHSGHNYLVYFTGNTTQAANDWVISGCYELSHERKYKAAFFYRLGSGDHNLRIAVGTAPQATAMEQVIWEQTQITAPSDQPYMHFGDVFEVDESGTYYF
ncbi:MAG: choice-of-anchor J domain-containing protein, partial [Bacteroidota bacterium]